MRKLQVILFSCLVASQVVHAAESREKCEPQMSKRPSVFARIAEGACRVGSLDLSDLRTYVEGNVSFAPKERGVGNLEQLRTLNSLYKQMSVEERSSSRRILRVVIEKLEREAQVVEEVSAKQKFVFNPKVILQLKPSFAIGKLKGHLLRTLRNGRPIFFGQYFIPNADLFKPGTLQYVMFDPFHPDENAQVKLLFQEEMGEESQRLDSIFEWKGQSYYATFENKFLWNIDEGKRHSVSIFENKSLEKVKLVGIYHAVVQTPLGLKLIAAGTGGVLREYNLSEPDKEPIVLLKRSYGMRLRSAELDGENVVFIANNGSVYARYVDRPGSDVVQIVEGSDGENVFALEGFRDQGRNFIFYVKSKNVAGVGEFRAVIAPLDLSPSETVLKGVVMDGYPLLLPSGHHPRLVLSTQDGLAEIDLRKQKLLENHSKNPDQIFSHKLLTWRGADYIVSGTRNNKLEFYNIKERSHVLSRRLPGGFVHPFVHEDVPYVMLESWDGPPVLVRVINPEDK